jgi:hypothetical protein
VGVAFRWSAHTPAFPWKEPVPKFRLIQENAGRTPCGVHMAEADAYLTAAGRQMKLLEEVPLSLNYLHSP